MKKWLLCRKRRDSDVLRWSIPVFEFWSQVGCPPHPTPLPPAGPRSTQDLKDNPPTTSPLKAIWVGRLCTCKRIRRETWHRENDGAFATMVTSPAVSNSNGLLSSLNNLGGRLDGQQSRRDG